jgi:Arc/MetJ-type ribon-helix-helix transcriptional regulator
MVLRQQKAVSRGLRYDEDVNQRIEAATEEGGFSSASAFMRAATERELAGRENFVDAAQQRIAASLDRMVKEIRNLRLGQQPLFAFVDVLAKTFSTCVPKRRGMCTAKPSPTAKRAATGFLRAWAWPWP